MRILLVGEYSRLHNSLKEGLASLGHEVTIIATGDGFKNFPADLKINRKYAQGLSKKLNVLLFKTFGKELGTAHVKKSFYKYGDQLKGYDVVQLISEAPFGILPEDEWELIEFLKQHNEKIFLLSCGADYSSVQFALEKKPRYSILTPYFEGKVSEKEYAPVLRFSSKPYKILSQKIHNIVDGIFASDFDYHLPLLDNEKYLGVIPNPINTSKLGVSPIEIEKKIIIFHGINRNNYYKKGSDLFEEALETIKKKYPKKVIIKTVESLPYSEYIETYNSAHIVLDQVYAYDQGYNALEAMAKGKVVFTGAEKEFLEHYNLSEDEVAINALPDVPKIIEKLSWLIDNPKQILEISENARAFVEKEHRYTSVASKYIEKWSSVD